MANKYDFNSDKIHVFFLSIDKSGSMINDEANVRLGVKGWYQKSFGDLKKADSISVSISMFDNNIYLNDFRPPVEDFYFSYSADGGTALYDAIIKGADYLMGYVKNVTKRNKCNPNVTFILFSDGRDEHSQSSFNEAYEAIQMLNFARIKTAFVAFGEAIKSDFGTRLGFSFTTDINDRKNVIQFFEETLSQSCKSQIEGTNPLGADFFSQANNSSSAGYSQTSAQALEDDSWIDEI